MSTKMKSTRCYSKDNQLSKADFEWKKMPIDLKRGYRAGAKDALEIVHLYISPSAEANKIIRKIKALTK